MIERLFRFGRTVSLVSGLALVGGCGVGNGSTNSQEPSRYLQEGRVVLQDTPGRQETLQGGRVILESVDQPKKTAIGFIDYDGSFTLATFNQNEAQEGVLEGEYVVTVVPPQIDRSGPRQGLLHPKFQNARTSGLRVQVPTDGQLVIPVSLSGR